MACESWLLRRVVRAKARRVSWRRVRWSRRSGRKRERRTSRPWIECPLSPVPAPICSTAMRLVFVNWARIWDGASSGGGVNGYVQALALALAARGHEVVSLCGGTAYVADGPGGAPGACRIVRHADWMSVRVFEVVNSPVLAPAIAQFREPAVEASG